MRKQATAEVNARAQHERKIREPNTAQHVKPAGSKPLVERTLRVNTYSYKAIHMTFLIHTQYTEHDMRMSVPPGVGVDSSQFNSLKLAFSNTHD